MVQNRDPYVQYQSLKAAEDAFTAMEKLLNYLSMKDIHYVDDKTASIGLEMVLTMGTQLDIS